MSTISCVDVMVLYLICGFGFIIIIIFSYVCNLFAFVYWCCKKLWTLVTTLTTHHF